MPDGHSGVLSWNDVSIHVDSTSGSAPTGFERPSYVLDNNKWGSGTRGTPGGTITWAVVTAGQTYPSQAEYTSQAIGISSEFMPTIRAAFSRWDAVGNFSFVETTSPLTADITLIFDQLDGQSASTIGLAYTYSIGPVTTNSYISFDLNHRYRLINGTVLTVGSTGSTLDFYTLALHEIGHALGLDHEDDFATVMNSAQNSSVTDLTSDDISAIRAIYGTGATPTPDDYAANTGTTGQISVGGTVTARIDDVSDEDWFRVTLAAGSSYRIDIRGNDSGGGTLLDPYLRILNAAGTELAFDDDGGTGIDSSLIFTPSTSGTYYVGATGFDGEMGTYTVSVVPSASGDDYAANTSTTGTVAVGGSATGSLETRGDSDWFGVTLTAGIVYRIDLRGAASGGGTLPDPMLLIRSLSGVAYTSDDDTGTGADAQLTYTAAYSGTHYLEVATFIAGVSNIGTYTLSVAQVGGGPDDYAASTSTTGAVAVGTNATGSIEASGDTDWFRVTLDAGTAYNFSLVGGTLTDPILYLRNSSGTTITSDDDSGVGLNSSLNYTPTTSGTYYLDARGVGTRTGSYTLSMTGTPPADDYTATTSTTGRVAIVGGFGLAVGRVETAGDHDWYNVSLVAGTTYRFELQGTERTGYTLPNPLLMLRNSAGGALASDDDSGTGASSLFYYTATTSGTYYLDASDAGTGTGVYYVYAASGVTIPDDYAATTATTGTVTVSGSATGNIESANDRDWLRVTLQAGQSYRFTASGALTSPVVSLMNSTGTVVVDDAAAGQSPDGQLTYTVTTAGTYYVGVRSNSATATGAYTVTVGPYDDYTATAATTGSVTLGSFVTGSIESAGDVDWIRVNLTAGTLYQFEGRGSASAGGTLTDPALSLLNSTGTGLITDNDSGTGADSRILFKPTTSGAYYLALRSNTASGTGTYRILATANPDDYTATAATDGFAPVGVSVTGLVETAGDRDWFRTVLTGGTTYTVQLAGTAIGSALRWSESSIVLRDANGAQVTSATRSGLGASASLTFTASSTGTYYLDTQAYSAGVGSYSVSIATGSAQAAEHSAIAEYPAISEDDLAAVTAPPAIALAEISLETAPAITALVDDSLRTILAPPADLFTPPAELQNPFMATPLDQLFQQQPSNTYNLLPF